MVGYKEGCFVPVVDGTQVSRKCCSLHNRVTTRLCTPRELQQTPNMFSRKLVYEQDEGMDDVGRRLAAELRRLIRSLGPYPLFSKEFLNMVNSLQHVASIALLEEKVSPLFTAHAFMENHNDSTTLWEREELSVRFLLEEGKLNLALRNIKEYKDFTRKAIKDPALLQEQMKKMKADQALLENRMLTYESSLGLLLKCAFTAVEALQTVDMQLLLQHITEVLAFATQNPEVFNSKEIDRLQESLVIYYLHSITNKIDKLQEDRVMSLLEEHQCVPNLVSCLHKNYKCYAPETLYEAALFLAHVIESEEFLTHRERFLSSEQERQVFEFKQLFLSSLPGLSATEKGKYQRLMDFKIVQQ